MTVLEERITALELEVSKINRVDFKTEKKIPHGYITPQDFYDQYIFMSDVSVRNLVKGESFFDDHKYVHGTYMFLDPVRVCEYFEKGMFTGARINNQYRRWKKHNENLRICADKAMLNIKQHENEVDTQGI